MSNSPSLIQKNVSLATFLATAVSDATESAVFVTAKTDASGQEAAATDIAEHGGQLWANGIDDAFLCAYALNYKSAKVWSVADATARDALGSDDDLAVSDLAFQIDTTGLWTCVSVDGGAASTWAAIAATGNVAGPGSSTDHAIARWDGAGGATLQDSTVIVTDLGAVSGITDITLSGTVDGRDIAADGTALDAHIASIANPHSTLLSQALAAGNTTNGTHLIVTNGDEINGTDGGAISFAAGTGIIGLTETAVTGDLAVSGKLSVAGLIDPTGLVLNEQASVPTSPAAGELVIWAKNTIPNQLWITDDAGNDAQLATASTAGLSAVLALGGNTGPNDITITDAAEIIGEAGVAGPGGPIAIVGGAGDGAEAGGAINLTGGEGGATGAGGTVNINAGAGGATSGAGGTIAISAGAGSAGDSAGGALLLSSGQPSGAGAPGTVSVTATAAVSGDVVGGSVTVDGGDGSGTAAGGAVVSTAGAGGASGDGGYGALNGGNGGASAGTGGSVFLQAGAGVASGALGGSIEITTGAAGSGAATGGSLYLLTGDGGAASGGSGGISLTTGGVTSGTRGAITLDGSDVIVSNQTYHSVRGSTARGSTNTQIYRWSAVVDAVGSGITYTDSATAGGSWAITQEGIYCVSMSIDVGHNGYVAIKRAAALSNTFDETSIMVAIEAFSGTTIAATWTGYCASGDDIWIASSAATNPTGTPVNNNRVTVTRVR